GRSRCPLRPSRGARRGWARARWSRLVLLAHGRWHPRQQVLDAALEQEVVVARVGQLQDARRLVAQRVGRWRGGGEDDLEPGRRLADLVYELQEAVVELGAHLALARAVEDQEPGVCSTAL